MPASIQYKPGDFSWKYIIFHYIFFAWLLAYSYDTRALVAQREQAEKDVIVRNLALASAPIKVAKPIHSPPTASVIPPAFLITGPTRTTNAADPVKRTSVMLPVEDFTWERDGTPLVPPPKPPVPLDVRLFNFYVFQNLPPPPPPPDTCTDDDYPGVEPIHWTETLKTRFKVHYMMLLERHDLDLESMSPIPAFAACVLIKLYLLIVLLVHKAFWTVIKLLLMISEEYVLGCVVAWIVGCIVRFKINLARNFAETKRMFEEEVKRRREERERRNYC